MIDTKIRQLIDAPLRRIGQRLVSAGLTANHLTYIGFLLGVAAGCAIIQGAFGWALALILLSRLCDGLDGTVARLTGPTDKGAFLDISLDFLFYAFIPLSFAFYDSANGLAAAFLLFCFIGTSSSFLSYAAIAEKRGQTAQSRGSKGIRYLGGLTEGAETIAFLCLICLIPSYFTLCAYIFGGLCLITIATRLYQGFIDFDEG